MDKIVINLHYLRSTKRTHVFSSTARADSTIPESIETLYISKSAFGGKEPPSTIAVTIEAAQA